ncbi:MAG: helix-turn-helix domain-containing protein [Cyanobacteria bacterium REEB446]|nr:helix-turn-helix domain-containing protein [Cyanobacteria bacterium REEB446]
MDCKKLLLSLGEIIREKRKALGYSQEGFADLVGLHRTYIGSVERGEKNISFINLRKIAEKLNISLSELLTTLPD